MPMLTGRRREDRLAGALQQLKSMKARMPHLRIRLVAGGARPDVIEVGVMSYPEDFVRLARVAKKHRLRMRAEQDMVVLYRGA